MARSMLPPSSEHALRSARALSRATSRYPERRSYRRRQKAKTFGEISLSLLATLGFVGYIVYTLRGRR